MTTRYDNRRYDNRRAKGRVVPTRAFRFLRHVYKVRERISGRYTFLDDIRARGTDRASLRRAIARLAREIRALQRHDNKEHTS